MVKKKIELLDEIKNYNVELEKHLSEVDFSMIDFIPLDDKTSKNKEYFSLFARNISDLRTEMNLFRKNVTSDIEGMLLNMIQEQKKMYASEIQILHSRLLLDMKNNFSRYVEDISDEMVKVKDELKKIKKEHTLLLSETEKLNTFFKNGDVNIMFDLRDGFFNFSKLIEKEVKVINKNFEKVFDEIHLNKDLIENNLSSDLKEFKLLNDNLNKKTKNLLSKEQKLEKELIKLEKNTIKNNKLGLKFVDYEKYLSKVNDDLSVLSKNFDENSNEQQLKKDKIIDVSKKENLNKFDGINSSLVINENLSNSDDESILDDIRNDVTISLKNKQLDSVRDSCDFCLVHPKSHLLNLENKFKKLNLLR